MRPVRAIFPLMAIAAAFAALRAQDAGGNRAVILQNVGLPAVDEGVMWEETHTPSTPEALRRAAVRTAVRTALRVDRMGASGARYVPGKVIVKFRDEASAAACQSAISAASASAQLTERPSYAN